MKEDGYAEMMKAHCRYQTVTRQERGRECLELAVLAMRASGVLPPEPGFQLAPRTSLDMAMDDEV